MVNITVRVLSRPSEDQLPKIYSTLGEDYDERVLPSIVNETLKSVVVRDFEYGVVIFPNKLKFEI